MEIEIDWSVKPQAANRVLVVLQDVGGANGALDGRQQKHAWARDNVAGTPSVLMRALVDHPDARMLAVMPTRQSDPPLGRTDALRLEDAISVPVQLVQSWAVWRDPAFARTASNDTLYWLEDYGGVAPTTEEVARDFDYVVCDLPKPPGPWFTAMSGTGAPPIVFGKAAINDTLNVQFLRCGRLTPESLLSMMTTRYGRRSKIVVVAGSGADDQARRTIDTLRRDNRLGGALLVENSPVAASLLTARDVMLTLARSSTMTARVVKKAWRHLGLHGLPAAPLMVLGEWRFEDDAARAAWLEGTSAIGRVHVYTPQALNAMAFGPKPPQSARVTLDCAELAQLVVELPEMQGGGLNPGAPGAGAGTDEDNEEEDECGCEDDSE